MKKAVCMISVIAILLTVLPSGCSRKGINKVTITPMAETKTEYGPSSEGLSIKSSVKPYSIDAELSGISNVSSASGLDLRDREMLAKNLFLIKRSGAAFAQPLDLYRENIEYGIPNLITSDCMLHIYHLMYDKVIKRVEKQRLIGELDAFTEASFKKAIEIYNGTGEKRAKKAAFKNICYFGIGMRILNIDLPGGIPLDANRIMDNDVKKVRGRWGSGTSEIFPYRLDYKRYTSKGYYSRLTEFNNYYTAMMWYGSAPFMFETYDDIGSPKILDEQVAMAVILTAQTLGDEKLKELWEDIYGVSSAYLGDLGDINIYDMSEIIETVYGDRIDFNRICGDAELKEVYRLAAKRYGERQSGSLSGRIKLLTEGYRLQPQFKLMGGIYDLDSAIYEYLTAAGGVEGRDMPDALDIPSAFGSDSALSLVRQRGCVGDGIQKYYHRIPEMRKVLSESAGSGRLFLNNSMDWIAGAIIDADKSGYPSFMTGKGYSIKELITFLGAVSDFRHTSLPSAGRVNSSGETERRGVEPVSSEMPGYVEPNIELYNRLQHMTKYLRSLISSMHLSDSDAYACLDYFYDAVEFLKGISLKEIENKSLSDNERMRLINFGDELKKLTSYASGNGVDIHAWETLSKIDGSTASVTDVYHYDNRVLQTAIGSPDYMYAVVPYDGKLYLTRGAAYSYYQSEVDNSKKLKDSDWQRLVESGKTEQHAWMDGIRR